MIEAHFQPACVFEFHERPWAKRALDHWFSPRRKFGARKAAYHANLNSYPMRWIDIAERSVICGTAAGSQFAEILDSAPRNRFNSALSRISTNRPMRLRPRQALKLGLLDGLESNFSPA